MVAGGGARCAQSELGAAGFSVPKNHHDWFVSHLNNRDELREIVKYYDFEDFIDSLRNDSGNFIQMYFEAAHNLFPKKNEADLTMI